jgi:hypothetical protein
MNTRSKLKASGFVRLGSSDSDRGANAGDKPKKSRKAAAETDQLSSTTNNASAKAATTDIGPSAVTVAQSLRKAIKVRYYTILVG